MRTKYHPGFTLIELSIVLVIIGLIVGGILVGQDLIRAAAIRGTIRQIENYEAAANTFRVKYNCIPGDCPIALQFGLGTPGGPGDNGDGNEEVFSAGAMSAFNLKESMNFWYHLSKANLIQETVTGGSPGSWPIANIAAYLPSAKIGNGAYISAFTVHNTVQPSTDNELGNAYLLSAVTAAGVYDYVISATDAYIFDSKFDDGFPMSGTVVVGVAYSGPRAMGMPDGAVLGCTMNNWHGVPDNHYDLNGTWYNGGADAAHDVNRIECQIFFGKAF